MHAYAIVINKNLLHEVLTNNISAIFIYEIGCLNIRYEPCVEIQVEDQTLLGKGTMGNYIGG